MTKSDYEVTKEEWEKGIKNKKSPDFMIFQKLHEILSGLEEIDNSIYQGFHPEY
ncbi:MAG: hypothetical protein ACI8RA_001673 [Chlamydiales bacterium]|jgi:hypothetical protein